MFEQFFFLRANNSMLVPVVELHLRTLLDQVVSIPLSDTSAFFRITHCREDAYGKRELLLDSVAKHVELIELGPAQLGEILSGHFAEWGKKRQGPGDTKKPNGEGDAKKQEDRRPRKKSNITERLANRVLDRISQVGMEGLNKFELRLIERYSEDLRLINDQKKRRA